MSEDILYIHDADGKLVAVQVSASLWRKLEPFARQENIPETCQSDMAAFAEFMAAWDFSYVYEAKVECPHCHSRSGDWRTDDKFVLVNANIGGLLVFQCRQCGATIRQKYFKGHMACEFTPPAP